MTDNSIYKPQHDAVVDYVLEQTGINLNDYRDGDGTSPFTTTHWDKGGFMTCINWCGTPGGMDRTTQNIISSLVAKSNGKLELEWGGAWFKYIFFTEDY